ncbi:MAG: sigma-70 family RNA polymerase sigma factor [Planctomycetota bacterium]|jgi:RNA polymerase sigma factor (TIGR02999 family)|nr:sigma-70 family RNA polymerase sigma factor [Planctomycetota bacterium]
MRGSDRQDLTEVLERASQGSDEARAEIWQRTYGELHAMARSLRRGRFAGPEARVPGATTIIHEAFMKCDGGAEPPAWENRAHFFGSVARAMGQFLIDWRRTATRQKRGGDRQPVALGDAADQLPSFEPLADPERALAEWTPRLAAALEALERDAPQTARVVWMRYMLGLSLDQTSEILGIAPRTVSKHWNLGRAWLRRALADWGEE